jgi:hypothetical protein
MSAFLGVDCGQASDPAAWVLCERRQFVKRPAIQLGPITESLETYSVLHATAYSRVALRTAYTEVVRKLAAIVAIPDLYRDVIVIVDCTRERAVYDIIRESPDFHGVTVIPMVITSGNHVTMDEYGWYKVPEAELLSSLVTSLEGERLKTFRNGGQEPGDSDAMESQLNHIKRRTSAKRKTVGMTADGTGEEHDDLAFSLSFAVWYAKYSGALGDIKVREREKDRPYNPATHGLTT